MNEDVKKVLTMVLLDNVSLNDIEGYSDEVIDEVSFYLGEAFDLLMTAYEQFTRLIRSPNDYIYVTNKKLNYAISTN